MKVEVIRRYSDRYTKEVHEVGDKIEITEERYSDLRRFVKEIKEVKKVTKKK